LGIEAQRAAVARFAAAERLAILQEFTEVETGEGAEPWSADLNSQPPLPWRSSESVRSSLPS
jgi:hypothetical protein